MKMLMALNNFNLVHLTNVVFHSCMKSQCCRHCTVKVIFFVKLSHAFDHLCLETTITPSKSLLLFELNASHKSVSLLFCKECGSMTSRRESVKNWINKQNQ